MVKYVYDSWGNHGIEVVGSACETRANLNPFRYRSYYFDTETELYFLKTRYYDPKIGRFMTIDGISYLDPETINGLNLYAYCGNNPVMNVDPIGKYINNSRYSYDMVAQSRGSTYFGTSQARWHEVKNMFGVGEKGMWKINKTFLKQQIKLGKQFVLTNDYIDGYLFKEVAHFLLKGINLFLI